MHFCKHMVYNISIVEMVVYDMQMQCGCALFVPMKFMALATTFAIVCMNINYFLITIYCIGMGSVSNHRVQTSMLFQRIKL